MCALCSGARRVLKFHNELLLQTRIFRYAVREVTPHSGWLTILPSTGPFCTQMLPELAISHLTQSLPTCRQSRC